MHTAYQLSIKKLAVARVKAKLAWIETNRPDQKSLIRHQRSVMIELQKQLLREGVRV